MSAADRLIGKAHDYDVSSATAGTERVHTGSCGALQRPAEPPRSVSSHTVFAACWIPSQLVRGDKMSDDAKFILGFDSGLRAL